MGRVILGAILGLALGATMGVRIKYLCAIRCQTKGTQP
jgi:hypothetical protein